MDEFSHVEITIKELKMTIKKTKRQTDLDFWEWINMVAPDVEVPEYQKRLWDFFSGRSTEDIKLVMASPRRTRTFQLIGARMLTKPWENHRIEPGADIVVEDCKTELVRFEGKVQVHVDDLVETYPDPCNDIMHRLTERQQADNEDIIDHLVGRHERGAGQSVSV